MRVKIFAAATMQEAMAQVKRELGIDAVILHTKRFHKGGFLGYMGKEMVEVTAAVEDAPKAVVEKPASKVAPVIPKEMLKQYVAATLLEDKEDEDNDFSQYGENPQRTMQIDLLNRDAKDEKIRQLQHELDSMKIMLEKMVSETEKSKTGRVSLTEALIEHDVDEKIVQAIISNILDEDVLINKDLPETVAYVANYLAHATRPARGIELCEGKAKVVALIGATGVGKTTTIAKIAANFVLEKGCSVALITADTYRISAVEQLKTYSDIIGLPIEIVYSPLELKNAIHKYSDKDLILIDTAGRSQHNEFQMRELKELLTIESDIEKHLVLSTTTKYKDAVDIIRKFSLCMPDRLLFTKVDETSSLGAIINLIHQYPIALSYLTDGQSVPDDIVVADSRKLAELILR